MPIQSSLEKTLCENDENFFYQEHHSLNLSSSVFPLKNLLVKFFLLLATKDSSSSSHQVAEVENPKCASRKLIELMNELDKVAGYKENTQKSVAFLSQSHLPITSKNMGHETIDLNLAETRLPYK